ncbi:MAG: hypothetical protein C0616_03955 [Desulfuromonas sp.]|nr:MAG: hypothetical protein C0616_03955 [Desulfuromonas sp.]
MKSCALCHREFDPELKFSEPEVELGAFLAREMFDDAENVCPACLASRGQLGMMYLREFD